MATFIENSRNNQENEDRMTEGEVILMFPKKKCTDTEFKGVPFIQVNTGMTTNQLIAMLLKYSASGESVGAVIERERE